MSQSVDTIERQTEFSCSCLNLRLKCLDRAPDSSWKNVVDTLSRIVAFPLHQFVVIVDSIDMVIPYEIAIIFHRQDELGLMLIKSLLCLQTLSHLIQFRQVHCNAFPTRRRSIPDLHEDGNRESSSWNVYSCRICDLDVFAVEEGSKKPRAVLSKTVKVEDRIVVSCGPGSLSIALFCDAVLFLYSLVANFTNFVPLPNYHLVLESQSRHTVCEMHHLVQHHHMKATNRLYPRT